jgi:hypothetical protein
MRDFAVRFCTPFLHALSQPYILKMYRSFTIKTLRIRNVWGLRSKLVCLFVQESESD